MLRHPKYIFPLFILVLSAGITACSLNLDAEDRRAISGEDVEAVSQIIGESLSDENSGIVGSLYDAINRISDNGFGQEATNSFKNEGHDFNSGRGSEDDITYSYDPNTGEHELSFFRKVDAPEYTKEVYDTVRYIYRDGEGELVEEPSENESSISFLNFTGFRQGEIITTERNSFFVRRDTFLIHGMSPAEALLNIDGIHRGDGSFQGISSEDSSRFEREYELEVSFLNIEVDKTVIEQDLGLEQGIRGALTYTLTIRDPDEPSVSRTVTGSIDMIGDGTAQLRLTQKRQKTFQVNLDNGEVTDIDEKFKGRIKSVQTDQQQFTLANGLVVQITEDTEVKVNSDLFSLEAVAEALQTSPNVRAEGEGMIRNGIFIAAEVEFEQDNDNDDKNDDIRFFEPVIAADPDSSTFILESGVEILIDNRTKFEEESAYQTLEEVSMAFAAGDTVMANGEAKYRNAPGVNYVAMEIEFRNENSLDTPDVELIGFKGPVKEVIVSANQFRLANGALIEISNDTEITGDVATLQDLEDLLENKSVILVDGEGRKPFQHEPTNANLIAEKVEFEVKKD